MTKKITATANKRPAPSGLRRRALPASPRTARTVRVRSPASIDRRTRLIEQKRSVILASALECFSRFGLHGTSVDQVAAKADVSKSNLLYYFNSKEDLYVEVLRDLLSVWLEPLRAFSMEQDPVESIKEYIRLKMVMSRDRPDASRLFCLEMVQGAPLLRDELGRALREIVAEKSAVIRAWIAAGKLGPVDPHHLIFALWAMTQHYADFSVQVHSILGKTLDDPGLFEEAIRNVQLIVLQGIAAQPAAAATS